MIWSVHGLIITLNSSCANQSDTIRVHTGFYGLLILITCI